MGDPVPGNRHADRAVPVHEIGSLLTLQRRVRFAAVYRAHCRNLGCEGRTHVGAAAATPRRHRLAARYRIGPYVIDLALPAERVAVEVDGRAWHVDAERFRSDRRRQNVLVTAGWTVLRFTWHDLDGHGTRVLAEIRAALNR